MSLISQKIPHDATVQVNDRKILATMKQLICLDLREQISKFSLTTTMKSKRI